MLTKVQILDETAEHFNLFNRAVENHKCKYLTEEGRSCAFGRCLTDEAREKVHRTNEGIACNMIGEDKDVQLMLQPQYRGHSFSFWRDVQVFHDTEENWSNAGVSEVGRAKLNSLKSLYA